MQRLELLEGQRVDGTHEPQLTFELADSGGGRHALGQLRAGGLDGFAGRAAVVAAQRFERRLEAEIDLGPIDVELLESGPRLGELSLGHRPIATQRLELGRCRTGLVGQALVAIAKRAQLTVDRMQPALELDGQLVGQPEAALEIDPTTPGALTFGLETAEATLDLGLTVAQELPALLDCCGAHLEIGAQGGNGASPLVEARAEKRELAALLGLFLVGGLEPRQHLGQLGGAGLIAVESLGDLGEVMLDAVELDLVLAHGAVGLFVAPRRPRSALAPKPCVHVRGRPRRSWPPTAPRPQPHARCAPRRGERWPTRRWTPPLRAPPRWRRFVVHRSASHLHRTGCRRE